MRKCKNVLINGIVFELKGTKTYVPYDENFDGIYNSLNDFYKSYSTYKKSAWNSICNWCRQMPKCGVEITSATSNFFVVRGWCNWNGIPYFVEFTGRHNRAMVCNATKYIKVKDEKHDNVCILYPEYFADVALEKGWEIVQ